MTLFAGADLDSLMQASLQGGPLLTHAPLTAGADIESILRSITGWVTGLAGDEDGALQDRIDQNEELHGILGRVSSLVEGLAGRSGDSVEIDVTYNLDVEVGRVSPCPPLILKVWLNCFAALHQHLGHSVFV